MDGIFKRMNPSPISPNLLMAVTRRVVDQFTAQGLLFTALDVSNVVKKSLAQVRHRDVAPLVRELFDEKAMGPLYTRSLIDVVANGNNRTQAYLYHLKGEDPQQYDDAQRQKLALPPIVLSPENETLPEHLQEMELKPGKDGRLRVPRTLLKRAGIHSSEVEVYLIAGGPDLQLCAVGMGDPQEHPAVILSISDPEVLHIPNVFVDGFDRNFEIFARVDGHHILIEGMPE